MSWLHRPWLALTAASIVLTACVSPRPAPVSDGTPTVRRVAPVVTPLPAPAAKPATAIPDAKPQFYTVKPGDTLYSIALEHGLDHRELAIWNGVETPSGLRVGQQLRVTPPSSGAVIAAPAPGAAAGVVAAPLKGAVGGVQAKPLGPGAAPSASPTPVPPPATGGLITEPKGVRLPYSDQALAQLARPDAPPVAKAEPQRTEPRAEPSGENARAPDELDWAWPVRGKVVGTFNEGTNKGIAIAGKLGQPVLASAPGRVIFSGTGIRGFGKLIVIKHNNTYLSVYAHNSELSVKEGQSVTKGQKIAEMGNTDSDQVKLHFEIRRFGKPIDPLKLLPNPA